MAATPFKVKALYEYTSPHDDDLSFPGSQVITVTEEEDADWYYGEYLDSSGSKKEGIFPRNFVERYEPEIPSRPARSNRPKKEVETTQAAPVPAALTEPAAADEPEEAPQPPAPVEAQSEPAEPASKEIRSPVSPPSEAPLPSRQPKPAAKPPPPSQTKPAPPVAAEKSAGGGGSFRDRIAAFNKPAAPPIAPFKPSGLSSSGGSGFIKKPFVAPPPSKDSYVPPPRQPPPQKVYHRDEEPEVEDKSIEDPAPTETEVPVSPPPAPESGESASNEPKPTSLKDRIALIQKQQQEQAARQAEVAQKKEKAKKPSKARAESSERTEVIGEEEDGGDLQRIGSGDTTGRQSIDKTYDESVGPSRPSRRKPSREPSSAVTPSLESKDFASDANDADQSAAGETTEDAEEGSPGRDDSDDRPRLADRSISSPKIAAYSGETDVKNEEDNSGEDEEEDEVDAETRRRMEIRERMAKMSGGVGMHGMFGAGMPAPSPAAGQKKKQPAGGNAHRPSGASENDPSSSKAPPVPMMPIPGMARPKSPTQFDPEMAEPEQYDYKSATAQKQGEDTQIAIEDSDEEVVEPAQRPAPPPVPKDRPVPPLPPAAERGPPPPVPNERPGIAPPAPPANARPVPPPPTVPMSPSAGSESDDEMSLHAKRLSLKTSTTDESGPDTSAQTPVPPTGPPNVPSRPGPFTPQSPSGARNDLATTPITPTSPPSNKRASRAPPVPGSSPMVPPPSQSRPPPPPPPTAVPPTRRSTNEAKPMTSPKQMEEDESDVEVTEYEGDYDTDIAPGATHKDALKAHTKEPALGDSPEGPPPPVRSPRPNAPSQAPPIPQVSAPRQVPPPPPPQQPPKTSRPSMDMPRAAPPPVPPGRQAKSPEYEEDYDPFRYSGSFQRAPTGYSQFDTTPSVAEPGNDDLYNSSPRQSKPPPLPSQAPGQQPRAVPPPPPNSGAPGLAVTQTPGRPAPRQSLDVQRNVSAPRRSMEQNRPAGEGGYIAVPADLGEGSHWWTQSNLLPPTFQGRKDIIYEVEESKTTSPDGQPLVSKDVYILFHDYSQTVINALFDPRNASDVQLEQRQEPPPQRLRQDQLEDSHSRFGQSISEAVASKQNTVIGDGTPHSLVLELLNPHPDALRPVGNRSYGANVYANLANASVQQHDEIRPGDIISFRNAKFQGHRGNLHQKYSAEVGKPDHVGVVVDWDGTKKKIRAFEQGRESKKVKIESFKLGDLKSGEVKIWRVMARGWVGWESKS
ncbi:MAG: hypothetical protein M4579_001790 [Chaenotheca gracillima]|nr:MAG: hypothetical protein M4579_001790 [Chaenotheca gracillima]